MSRRFLAPAPALAATYAGLSVLLVARSLTPVTPTAPTRLYLLAGTAGLLLVPGILLLGTRSARWPLHALLGLATVGHSLLLVAAGSAGEAMLTATAYPVLVTYAVVVLGAGARGHLVLVGVGLTAGMAASGVPRLAAAWLATLVPCAGVAAALGGLRRELQARAVTDEVTGLPNRAGFRAAAAREVARAGRGKGPLTMAVVDVAGFRQVLDAYGPAAADAVLLRLTRAWRAQLRAADLLACLGGGRFVLVLPDTDETATRRVLDRLQAADPARWTVGLTQWRPGDSVDTLLQRAEPRKPGAAPASLRTPQRK